VFEIGHEDIRPRVESVDHHLPVGRAGDLHPAPLQVRRSRGHLPGWIEAYRLRLGEKIGHFTSVQGLLTLLSCSQQRLPPVVEAALQAGDKGERLWGENLLVLRCDRSVDLHTGRELSFHSFLLMLYGYAALTNQSRRL